MSDLLRGFRNSIDALADARIVRARDGGPIRTMIVGGRTHRTGLFVSRKVGRAMPWESPVERTIYSILEADPGVVSFLAQPHRLEMRDGLSRTLIYFPDVERVAADGAIDIFEAKSKKDRRHLRDPHYIRKIELAAGIYRRLGWNFAVVEEAELEATPIAATCRRIVAARGTLVDTTARLEVLQALAPHPSGLPREDLLQILGSFPAAARRLDALVLDRTLTLDFGAPQNGRSLIRLASATESALPLGRPIWP